MPCAISRTVEAGSYAQFLITSILSVGPPEKSALRTATTRSFPMSRRPGTALLAIAVIGFAVAGCDATPGPNNRTLGGGIDMPSADDTKFNPLSDKEAEVILRKGTELPFTG